MQNRSLAVDFQNHRIEINNVFQPLKWQSYEVLKIDGQVVAQSESAMFRQQTELSAPLRLNGAIRIVTARIAADDSDPLRVGFQLFVDGELIGGAKKLRFTEEAEIHEVCEGGFLKFALLRGIPTFGLPYAAIMTITSPLHGTLSLRSLVIWVLGFGLMASAFSFFVLKRRWKY